MDFYMLPTPTYVPIYTHKLYERHATAYASLQESFLEQWALWEVYAQQ